MIRRPPRSTPKPSSAASDVYKRQADMAHLAGLIAAGVYPSPVPYADVVTSTTHKTLGGARGGLILCRGSLADRIDAAVFPGHQGGALNQSIAAKAATFHLAGRPGFVERQRRTLQGAKMIAERLCQPDIRSSGIQVVTGGTDCHLVLLDWCCCCLLYTSPSPRDQRGSRMPSSA